MIPINEHFLIEPLKFTEFIPGEKQQYQEIGIVLKKPNELPPFDKIPLGSKVFFDSWKAAKFPKNDDEFFWLVPYSDIRAYEINKPLPE